MLISVVGGAFIAVSMAMIVYQQWLPPLPRIALAYAMMLFIPGAMIALDLSASVIAYLSMLILLSLFHPKPKQNASRAQRMPPGR